ncbi:acyltransferase family protein [Tunturibacter empetritectus]|uniref:Peptidoglycan/LPS O-acetylase OafA/YrhL n=2 Tax=Tunturiibacter empetritectus TaxID=3069691 RepID=A0A7W8IIV8_9BACT|nr:acyltransferase [Edaphobacter lichenicola]MBB5317975.1 peptidoglycan/LPS O-acetylase OafA/YrhL [Edaphobacter lichenicola]
MQVTQSASGKMPDGKRITQLDGLRAIAVLMVFMSHAVRSQLLWSGVDLFFILSGFLITGVLLDLRSQNTWRTYIVAFYKRRAQRILPPYILFLIVTSVLFGWAWTHRWYLYFFLMNMPAFAPPVPYGHGVLWSLAVEEQFYLIWPILVYLLSERALAWLSGVLILAAPLLRWFATAYFTRHWLIYTALPFRMDLLAAGALIAMVWRHYPAAIFRWGIKGSWLAAIIVFALCMLSMHPWFQPGADTALVNVWLYELILVGYAAGFIWILSGRCVNFLRTRPMVYLGRISYSVYLIHLAALVFIRQFTRHSLASAAVALAVTLCYAALSWKWVEQPILQRHADAEDLHVPLPNQS